MLNRQTQSMAQVRHRSPLYPCKTLSFSIKRCEDLYKKYPNGRVSPAEACQAWGLSQTNGRMSSLLATLHYYGLTEDIGRGASRRISLSVMGKELASNRTPDPILKKAAALKPDVFQELWRQFRTARNANEKAIVAELTAARVDRGETPFNQDAVAKVITSFKANVAFSGLRDSDDIDGIERDADMRLERFTNAHAASRFEFEQSCSRGATAASTGDDEAQDVAAIFEAQKTAVGGTRKISASMNPSGEANVSWPHGADLGQLGEFLRMVTRMIDAEARSQRSH